MNKTVSVIMGVYNCEDTLAEALECIVKQSYAQWEIIMCDDGSQDNTVGIAREYVKRYPNQIKLLYNEHNMGLNYTLNRCLAETCRIYIARMDGDDRCSPNRLEKEVAVLEQHPNIQIVSTEMEMFDQNGVWGRTHAIEFPQERDLLKGPPFCHAACMVRKEAFEAVEGYSVEERLLRVEDYHLWVKMYERGYRGMNILEPLYSMRDDRSATQRRKFKYRLNSAYVKAYAVKHLNLPLYGYIYCLKPILIGLMPQWLYKCMHRICNSKE